MKYALLGYTYQHYVACLLLAMMDVERKIQKISLETDVNHKFLCKAVLQIQYTK